MGKSTSIGWCDHTFNPWWGCTRVSPGCDNCYAETFDKRNFPVNIGTAEDPEYIAKHWGKGAERRTLSDKYWREPMKWNRDAIGEFGRRARVFCASMADVMDDEAPKGQRERLYELIDETPNLFWLLLTKRPHRYPVYLPARFKHNNVALGTTAENQPFYDVRFPIVYKEAKKRGLVTWISYEPAIGPVTMTKHADVPDWIIFGGESGADAKRRPSSPEWARALRDECKPIGVSFFCKQMSARTPDAGKALIPADLRIHEFAMQPRLASHFIQGDIR